MDSVLATIGLPIAIAIIMFGLGLGLTLADFQRVGRKPRAVVVALCCQLLILPAICFGLVILFGLPPLLAIGLMLLAASPGGTSANLFSHLFRPDLAHFGRLKVAVGLCAGCFLFVCAVFTH